MFAKRSLFFAGAAVVLGIFLRLRAPNNYDDSYPSLDSDTQKHFPKLSWQNVADEGIPACSAPMIIRGGFILQNSSEFYFRDQFLELFGEKMAEAFPPSHITYGRNISSYLATNLRKDF